MPVLSKNNIIMKKLFTTLLLAGIFATATAQFGRAPVVSPELAGDNSATFRLYAPEAGEVTISGSWLDGWGVSQPLQVNDTGLWTITVRNLEPELYTYTFGVNGIRTIDPSNPATVRDGRRNESMFIVPGGRGDLYSTGNLPGGTLSKVWYPSPSLGMDRLMYVYTPACYNGSDTNYPVLYLLHGGGGDEDAWTTLGRAPQIMDNLIASGRAEPMLVVMTNGNPTEQAAPVVHLTGGRDREQPPAGGMAGGRFERSLVEDVIPFIEKNYRVDARSQSRAVAGLSMGGIQTMSLSFTYPEKFDWYGVMSMGLVDMTRFGVEDDYESRKSNLGRLRGTNPSLYWIACGTEDFLYSSVIELIAFLESQDFPHTYLETNGGHTWDRWRLYLSELAPLLFR